MAGKRVEPQDIINRARALIGTRFRLHGRDPATGLDCVGLVACAYALTDELPTGYPLRGGAADDYLRMIDQFAGRSAGAPVPADTLLIAPGPQQFHVGIWTGASLIHAHAGLRKVVETPGTIVDPIIATWHSSKDIT
jgi:cell wall-associated NlpC family hydrolase